MVTDEFFWRSLIDLTRLDYMVLEWVFAIRVVEENRIAKENSDRRG